MGETGTISLVLGSFGGSLREARVGPEAEGKASQGKLFSGHTPANKPLCQGRVEDRGTGL